MNDHHEESEIVARLAGLERSVAPPRDLWPGIATRITAPVGVRPRSSTAPWLMAAAAVLFFLFGAAFVYHGAPGHRAAVPDPALDELRAAEADYARAALRLQDALDRSAQNLPPDSRAVVEENLRLIDAAIETARVALRDAPRDPTVNLLLANLYHEKLGLLRAATAATQTRNPG